MEAMPVALAAKPRSACYAGPLFVKAGRVPVARSTTVRGSQRWAERPVSSRRAPSARRARPMPWLCASPGSGDSAQGNPQFSKQQPPSASASTSASSKSRLQPPPVRPSPPQSSSGKGGEGNVRAGVADDSLAVTEGQRGRGGNKKVGRESGPGPRGRFVVGGGKGGEVDRTEVPSSGSAGKSAGDGSRGEAAKNESSRMTLAQRADNVLRAIDERGAKVPERDRNLAEGEISDGAEAPRVLQNTNTDGSRGLGPSNRSGASGASSREHGELESEQTDEDSQASEDLPRDELIRLEGRECERCGDALLARELYRRCVELEPSNGKGWQDLAKVEGRIRGGLRRSAAVLRRALAANPGNAYLWQSLGFLEVRMGRYDDARVTFQDGIEADPYHAPLYSTWGRMEGGLGLHGRARELFERGASADPACARLYYTWGVFELKLGNTGRANELFQKGLALEPNNAFIWQTLGTIAVDEGEFDRARGCFERALVEDQDNIVVLDHWGRLETRLGNTCRAQELFERGVAANPFDSRVLQAWSLMELQRGDLDSARRLVKRAVAINPRDCILWDQFAKIEVASGNFPKARALFKRGSEVAPQDWMVWDNWSAMEYQLGNYEESSALLKRSFAIRFKTRGEFTILANSIEEDKLENHSSSAGPPPRRPS